MCSELRQIAVLTEQGVFHREFLEPHVVLGQSACLVSEQELNPTELFWNRAIPDDTAWHSGIGLDEPRVVNFGQIQVYSHRDWYDGAQEQIHAEVLEDPATLEPVKGHNNERN